jgi:6-phosphogluconolactonase
MKPALHVHADLRESARAAADFLLSRARAALSAQGHLTIALSGGSTPRALYAHMREWTLPWQSVELCFGDERCVPPDHPDSNARMVQETLTAKGALSEAHVHRMRGELPPEQAARDYERALRQLFGKVSLPRFDIVLLGLGADGHTASLFPHSAALAESEAWVSANFVEGQAHPRLTLTYPVLNAAQLVVFLVSGADKARALREVLQGQESCQNIPARCVKPSSGELTFFVDEAAASELRNT